MSIGWECGEGATNLELSSLGVEGAAGLKFFFLCVLFFFLAIPRGLQNLNSGTRD